MFIMGSPISFSAYLLLTLLTISLVNISVSETDLYDVLGVSTRSSLSEIKKAYKKLAREWHPDKNKAEGASEKFMEINKAYEILGDEDKRKQYDTHGTVDERSEGMGDFFHGFHGFHFNFGDRGSSVLEGYKITHRQYKNRILPESDEKPCLIYVYHTFCLVCSMQVEPVWAHVASEMEPLGLSVGAFNVRADRSLAEALSVSSGPWIVGVISGRRHYFRGEVTTKNVRKFIRGILPRNLVTTVTDDNAEKFLDGWTDNRVRILFFKNYPNPPFRVLLLAFANRNRISLGFVDTGSDNGAEIRKRLGVKTSKEYAFVFREDKTAPVASTSAATIGRPELDNLVSDNKWLQVPRLSSQSLFDIFCPVSESFRKRSMSMCVILVIESEDVRNRELQTYRSIVGNLSKSFDFYKFFYIYSDKQKPFINSFIAPSRSEEGASKLLVLSRYADAFANFEWLSIGFDGEQKKNQLKDTLADYLDEERPLPSDKAELRPLINEHLDPLLTRIWDRLAQYLDITIEYITKQDPTTVMYALTFIVVGIITAKTMTNLAAAEDEKIHGPRPKKRPAANRDGPVIKLHELNSKSYGPLVTSQKASARCVCVLTEESTRRETLERFYTIVQPYLKQVGWRLAYLPVEEEWARAWYRALLVSGLQREELPELDAARCRGTVIALSGRRNYYCVYHPIVRKPTGGFLGFEEQVSDDSADDSEEVRHKLVDTMSSRLSGLAAWLERLYDGTLTRIELNHWPEMQGSSEKS